MRNETIILVCLSQNETDREQVRQYNTTTYERDLRPEMMDDGDGLTSNLYLTLHSIDDSKSILKSNVTSRVGPPTPFGPRPSTLASPSPASRHLIHLRHVSVAGAQGTGARDPEIPRSRDEHPRKARLQRQSRATTTARARAQARADILVRKDNSMTLNSNSRAVQS